jgi:hypothetical protein
MHGLGNTSSRLLRAANDSIQEDVASSNSDKVRFSEPHSLSLRYHCSAINEVLRAFGILFQFHESIDVVGQVVQASLLLNDHTSWPPISSVQRYHLWLVE